MSSTGADAKALPEREVEVVAIGAALALSNVRTGVESVLAKRAELGARLASFDAAAFSRTTTLALAYGSASRRVDRSGTGEVAQLYATLAPLRSLAPTSADALSQAGLVPKADVARIRDQAYKEGMKPLRISGAMKIASGMTTFEEVLKVAPPPGQA